MNNQDAKVSEMERIHQLQKNTAIKLRTSTLKERIAKINKIKSWTLENEEAICNAMHKDFGKAKTEVILTEVMPVIGEAKYTSKNLKEWLQPSSSPVPILFLGTSNKLIQEPKGTTLIISPWNYPFHLTIKPLISSLAAGNTAILKPSELTPHTAELMERMISELFDEDEVAVFNGGADVAVNLQKLNFDHIFFTGSPQVGKLVMSAAAKNLSSVTLELGGKSPTIVDESADLQKAADTIVFGKFLNAGQTCVAPDYSLVHHSIYDKFVLALEKSIIKQSKGNARESIDFCRIVNNKHYERVNALIQDSSKMGAKVLSGGDTDASTNFIEPTIMGDITMEMPIMQEEIFGPVLPIIAYSNLDEAISLINAKEKPLALYIFSKNRGNQKKIIKETSAGAVLINEISIQTIYKGVPFGGVNNSGIGKTGGKFGFQEFSNLKPVVKNHFAATSLFFPPYTNTVQKMAKFVARYIA